MEIISALFAKFKNINFRGVGAKPPDEPEHDELAIVMTFLTQERRAMVLVGDGSEMAVDKYQRGLSIAKLDTATKEVPVPSPQSQAKEHVIR